MAVEKLLGIEVPERAMWIRMMMSELNRISLAPGVDGDQRHGPRVASSMMIYGLRERELILAFFEKTAGLRMNLNYVRPGGVAADLPDGWQDDVEVDLRHDLRAHLRVRRAPHRPADLSQAHGRRRRRSPPRRRWRSA